MGIPVIANGDIFNLKDVAQVHSSTGVDGVMCARGMLQNPAMFSGCESTPKECIKDWVSENSTIYHIKMVPYEAKFNLRYVLI